jgi:hypothetical protein
MRFPLPFFVYLRYLRLLLSFGTYTLILSPSFLFPHIPHFVAMASSFSSEDLNEFSKTCSQDFQTSEQDRAAAKQQANEQDSENGAVSKEKGGTIPRADGGRDAWLFLAACFVFEALIWGAFLLSSAEKSCTLKRF